jgi:hypothetical protein
MKYGIVLGVIIYLLSIVNAFAGCTPAQVEKMLNAGFTKSEIQSICDQQASGQNHEEKPTPSHTVAPFNFTMIPLQGVNFKGGSKVAFNADFASWPQNTTKSGIARAEGGGYGLEAKTNTWIGPGQYIPIRPEIRGDFIMDLTFRFVHRTDASLSISLSDAGSNYSQVEFFFDIWKSGRCTYSIYENWVKNDFYVNVRRKFADRMPVKFSTDKIDWARKNTLTIKREGKQMRFYLNNMALDTFYVPLFPLKKMSLGLAFKSKVLFTAVRARIPK